MFPSAKAKEFIIELTETFVVSFVVIMVIYLFLAFPEIVSGASMEPSLFDKERILVEKITKHFKPFERGEVVVFHPPNDDNIDYVKRIIGVPGDIIKISDCKVYITRDGNRFMLEEPYLYENICTYGGSTIKEGQAMKIKDGGYAVFGDNRTKSADSRVLGFIEEDRIVGRVVFRFWPFSVAGFL